MSSPEAIIPSTWVSAPSWTTGPELDGWLAQGSWAAAVQAMDYLTWNYAYCSGVCKVLIDPNSDMLFQVRLNYTGRCTATVAWYAGCISMH
jgi:hypothetical protein